MSSHKVYVLLLIIIYIMEYTNRYFIKEANNKFHVNFLTVIEVLHAKKRKELRKLTDKFSQNFVYVPASVNGIIWIVSSCRHQ